MAAQIWIDTQTGTWGDTAKLVIISEETTPLSADEVAAELAEMSDSEINDFGQLQGEPVISLYDAASWLAGVSSDVREAFLAHFEPEQG